MPDEEELLSLTRALHLFDLSLLLSPSSSTTLSPADKVAFKLYASELQSAQSFADDLRMARSLDLAGMRDEGFLRGFEERERGERRDREIALAVSKGGIIPRAAPTTSGSTPPRTYDPINITSTVTLRKSPSTVTPISSSLASLKRVEKKVECVICSEDIVPSMGILVECASRHYYCIGCARRLFVAAMNDESLIPPK